ncbi:sensor histidine kinase [Tabrizicola sp. TH137]|uniref:sensor histidine kinase n=1 Tax=Tabrizicola sp. TH137 TaxID=2067452 RepID=UPI000C7A158A|nr:HAMP domain-containing sensor histidine kinase [Tabrizicola sp. TH137]PLL10794.1 sensor histidine kinase [Tabrizicola sp. TH137]
MRRASLRLRLALAGALVLILTLIAAQIGLSILFNRHAERAIAAELSDRSDFLIAAVEAGADGSLTLPSPPTDPAYERPYSGRYWAVASDAESWTSRSLWDFTLTLPAAPPPGEDAILTLPGPQDTSLLALDRSVIRSTAQGDRTLRITVALDRARIDAARAAFEAEMLPWLAALGLLLLAAGAVQIVVGLAPLATLGRRLGDLTSGREDRIGDSVPVEIAPLARQIDALLEARAQEIDRSRRRAADLAHGLKTPLQALLGEAQRLRSQGRNDEADGVETVVHSIRKQVDRELARATIAGSAASVRADVARAVEGVVAVLRRTPAGAALDWRIDAPAQHFARIDSADLTEALGALVENAVTHARACVTLTVARSGPHIHVTIRDDGPGMPSDQIARLRQRGQRLDTSGEGSGLGLSIADEIAVSAGGDLIIKDTGQGLAVTLVLAALPEA